MLAVFTVFFLLEVDIGFTIGIEKVITRAVYEPYYNSTAELALCNVTSQDDMIISINNLIYWSFPGIYYDPYGTEYVNGAKIYNLNCTDP